MGMILNFPSIDNIMQMLACRGGCVSNARH
jgi:hypothetical protein